MVLHLIPIAIGAVVAAILDGCDTEAVTEYVCNPVTDPPPPPPGPHEFLVTDGYYTVVADKRITQAAAHFYLKRMSQSAQEVLGLFAIRSPWQHHFNMYLVDVNSLNNFCGTDSGCSLPGKMGFPLSAEKMQIVNEAALLDVAVVPLTHETSHVLRIGVANTWAGLEEGLAVYTETMLLGRHGLTGGTPNVIAPRLFQGALHLGEVIPTPAAQSMADIKLVSISNVQPPELTFIVRRKDLQDYFLERVSVGLPSTISTDVLMVATGDLTTGISLSMYQRSAFMLGEYIHYKDEGFDTSCQNLGYTQFQTAHTEDGIIIGAEQFFLHAHPDPEAAYKHFYKSGISYVTEFCFWDTIRSRYGHAAVQNIVQAMTHFSTQHQTFPAPFLFYQTVKEITGMNDIDAKTLFDQVTAPMNNQRYKLGGFCW